MEAGLLLKPIEKIESKYYLRTNVSDKIGVLAKVTKIFEENNISIETILQRPSVDASVNLLISTHIALERDIQDLITALESLEFVNSKPVMIRIV